MVYVSICNDLTCDRNIKSYLLERPCNVCLYDMLTSRNVSILFQRVQDFIAINEARVRDVEIITGLRFFTTISVEDRVKLQISLPDGTWRAT